MNTVRLALAGRPLQMLTLLALSIVMGRLLETPDRPASNIKGGARLARCNQYWPIQSEV